MTWLVSCACFFLRSVFWLFSWILTCCWLRAMDLFYHVFCCCMDCPQSLGLGHGLRSVDCWADFLLGVWYGLFILVSWLPCCCMHCDMLLDVRHGLWFVVWCTSWTVYHGFLAARLLHGLWFVAWCVCVMDCVSCFLGRCVTCCCIDLICCLV